MGRFSRSWALVKESYQVLKATPSLAFFPIVSGIASFVVALSFFLPIFLVGGLKRESNHSPMYYVVMFAFYAVSYFVVIFFNAGLVSCAHDSLNGRPTSAKAGLENAFRHLGSIIVWSLIAATVGTILRFISERAGIVGRIVIALLGMAWTMLTYFVVPLIVIESKAPTKALKESGGMLKRTWGEQIIGGASISLGFTLLMLLIIVPIAAVGFLLAAGLWVVAIAVGFMTIMYIMFLAVLSSTLSGIYNTALYIYASTGQVPNGFSEEYIHGAFVQKQRKGFIGR